MGFLDCYSEVQKNLRITENGYSSVSLLRMQLTETIWLSRPEESTRRSI